MNRSSVLKTSAIMALTMSLGCAAAPDEDSLASHEAADSDAPQTRVSDVDVLPAALSSRRPPRWRWPSNYGGTATTPPATAPVTTPPAVTTPPPAVTTPPPAVTTPPADTSTPAPSSSAAPLGGPGGYYNNILNDVFGSARSGANITSTSAFNPNTPYGANGSGWDSTMHYWNARGTYANAVMQADHLQLAPTGGPASVIVSHLEVLPTASKSYYVEVKAATGRGAFGNGQTSWPCIFLYAGNEPGGNDQGSEIDFMETYTDLQFGTQADSSGLYTHYFTTTVHNSPSHTQLGGPWPIATPGIDVTTSFNTYGLELTLVNGQVVWNTYFNGNLVQTSPRPIPWNSTPPAIIVGWNPGSSPNASALFKLDSVRVWTK